MKHTISMRCLAHHVQGVATILMMIGAHMTVLFVIKVKIIVLIKVAIQPPPQSFSLLSLEWFIIFSTHNPISFEHMLFGMCFWIHA